MSDLVAWLQEQLDRDERDIEESRALNAVDLHWSMPDWLHRDRMLAEVEAKRRILDLHAIKAEPVQQSPFDPFTGERREPEYNVTCEICGWATSDPTSACPTLRLLALPYADREGYDEAWRP